MAGYYAFTLDVRVSVHLSISQHCIHLVTFYTPAHDNGRVLWFHVGHPCVCSSVRLSISRTSVCISFPDDNLSKRQWIFTKFGLCIDVVEIWFGIANEQISSNIAQDTPIFLFPDNNFSMCQGILTKLGTYIDIREIWFWIANGQIWSMLDRVMSPRHVNGSVL